MKKIVVKMLVLVCVSVLLTGCQTNKTETKNATPSKGLSFQDTLTWEEIGPGLSYATLSLKTENEKEPKALVIAVIDPKQYNFAIYQNLTNETAKTIKEIHTEENSLLTFNGGFFTENFQPTGLLISNGETLRETSQAKLLNGIFTIDKNGNATLIKQAEENTENYTFAIQSGPILIDETGEIAIKNESTDSASRTAIGLNKDGKIVLIVLKQSLLNMDNKITLYQFAKLLKESPQLQELNLHGVLNLDGGTSSGIMIDDRYYAEMVKVQNIITVK